MIRFSLTIEGSNTGTIPPIMSAYYARCASGYVEGEQCVVNGLQALGGTFDTMVTVDLFNDESVPLTRQLKDLMNLATIWTDYTQDFQIPASDTNNAIFANWFDENLVLGDWNPNIGKNATIYIHGLPVFEGRVELIGCKFKDGLPQLYNIIFYGTTKKLLDAWGEKVMNEVDWSAYNHTGKSGAAKALKASAIAISPSPPFGMAFRTGSAWMAARRLAYWAEVSGITGCPQ